MVDVHIEGHGKEDRTLRDTDVELKDGHVGVKAFTIPFFDFDPKALPFINSVGSLEMAIDARFSGTPEGVHNGEDSTLWTASTITPTWDFSSTTHAHEGIITVTGFGSLSGATMQVDGTNITGTTRTEGVEWTAETSNEVTAGNLQTVLDTIGGISATVSGAVITVVADPLSDITTFTESDPTNMPATAQSIDGTGTVNGSQALFTDSGSIDFDNFVAATGWVYLTTFNEARNELLVQFRLGGVIVGNEIDLTDFVNPALLDQWQQFVLIKSSFGIDGDVVDELTLTVNNTSGVSPNFYIDRMQVEETGGATFAATPGRGKRFFVTLFDLILADALAGTLSNGTMPALSYDQILGVSKLTLGGVTLTRFRKGEIAFRQNFTCIGDMMFGGIDIVTNISDGTNTFLKMRNTIPGPVQMDQKPGDRLELTFAEDLSGLLTFRALARGNELVGKI